MIKKQKKQIVVILLLILLSVSNVLAIGIRPAETNIQSEETSFVEDEFWVINNEGRSFSAEISVAGEMAKYVTLNTNKLKFKEDDDSLSVQFSVELPEEIEEGKSIASIIVEENIDSLSENVISSKIILKHKIIIHGPYPEKYVVAKININELADGFELLSEVENLGTEKIETLYTTFYLNNKKQEINTDEVSLSTDENKILKKIIDKEMLSVGEHEISAITYFDDQKVEIFQKVIVGEPEIEITYFDSFFKENSINPYTLELLSYWNDELENVFVDVSVEKDGKEVDNFRTESTSLDALMRKTMNGYYDAIGFYSGTYSFIMDVNYWNSFKMDSQTFTVNLLDETQFNSNALVGSAVSSPNQKSNSSTVIIIISVIVLLALMGSYVLYRYVHKDEYEDDDEEEGFY